MKKANESTNVKKPFYKKWWFIAIVVIAVIGAIFGSDEEDVKTGSEIQSNEETIENLIEESKQEENTENAEELDEKLIFELVAGVQGEYGKMITYNKGTELEENFYAFYVPAGTYKVTNIGEYMNQINVYSDEIQKTEAGWEEPVDGYAELLDVNSSKIITVEEGQHIEIQEPSNFRFEQQ